MNPSLADIEITDLLPHQGPMVLIDALVDHDDSRTVCQVEITPRSRFVEPGMGVPNWVGIEYIAQTIAAHSGSEAMLRGDPVSVGFLLGTRALNFATEYFTVGQRLRVEVTNEWNNEHLGSFRGLIFDEATGEELVAGRITVFNPEDAEEFLRGA